MNADVLWYAKSHSQLELKKNIKQCPYDMKKNRMIKEKIQVYPVDSFWSNQISLSFDINYSSCEK